MTDQKRFASLSSEKSIKEDHLRPSLNSHNPEERKLARRLRIENRLKVLDKDSKTTVDLTSPDEIAFQVEKCADNLDKFIQEGTNYINNVSKANNIRQVERQKSHRNKKAKIMAEFQVQAIEAQKKFEEITNKWISLKNHNDPLEINEAILQQKAKCEELIRHKDEFIGKLKSEVELVDKQFQIDSEKQHDDIEILSERIEEQIKLMRKAFQKQFGMIYNVVNTERDKFIELHDDIWNELYRKYDESVSDSDEFKIRKRAEIREKINHLYLRFEDEVIYTRASLYQDVQYAQLELERIKALFVTNLQKFEYNLQLYQKRENENIIIRADHKRKMNKLKDHMSRLKKQLHNYKTTTGDQIKKLVANLKAMYNKILSVEDKADHLAIVNDKKFQELWTMNRNHVLGLLNKIFATDRILQQQHMGLRGATPSYKSIDMHLMPSYDQAFYILQNMNTYKSSSITTKDSHSKTTLKPSASSTSQDIRTKKPDASMTPTSSVEIMDSNPSYRKLAKHLLTILSDKSGFLTENRLKKIITHFEDDECTLVKLSNVFESLEIERNEDVNILINYLLAYCYCPTCAEQCYGGTPSPYSPMEPNKAYSGMTKSEVSHTANLFIAELENAFEAIQQPDEVIEDLVLELADSNFSLGEHDKMNISVSEDILSGLLDYHAEIKEKKAAKKRLIYPEEKLLCKYRHPLVISSIYIMQALKQFVIFYYSHKNKAPTTGERINRRRFTLTRLLSNSDIKMVFQLLKNVYGEEHTRIWNGLQEGIKKYHDILTNRKILSEEVVVLKQKNKKLKELLRIYMDHKNFMPTICTRR